MNRVVDLPRRRAGATPALLRQALQRIDAHTEPAAALQCLIDDGLDDLPWPASGRTLLRWQCLAEVAAWDLSLVKLYEGHTDALAILHELGCDDRHMPGRAWGVWAAEAPQARTLIEVRADGSLRLQQRKAWCSGAPALSHALATAWFADGSGPQLVLIDMQHSRRQPAAGAGVDNEPADSEASIRIERSNWQAVGMADSTSLDLVFDAAPAEAVGGVGDYVARRGFWHGGAGIAACWYGATRALADDLFSAVSRPGGPVRPEHALRRVALGKVDLALRRCASLLRETAHWIDAHPRADAHVPALRVRLAAERCATEVLELVGGALGAGPLCRDRGIARRFADLPVFIRQCHGERDFLTLGTAIAEAGPAEHGALPDGHRQPALSTAISTSESAWQL